MALITASHLSAVSSSPQVIPQTQGTALTGAFVTFPKAGSKKPIVLVLSFSHKASGDVTAWNKHFEADYTSGLVDYYELADFQGVPSWIMKMILHGMRRSVQEPEQSHLIPFFSGENEWKGLVGYSSPSIAYVVLADGSGRIASQTRGPASVAKAADLDAIIAKLNSVGQGK